MNVINKNLRFLIGTTIGNSQVLFPLNYYREEYKGKIVRSDSDCCIEGFQRSGNSFFFIQFKRKNKTLKIAHHTHAAAQIIRAVNFRLPTLVLIREPVETISSLIAWDTNLKSKIALKAYISFYKKVLPIKKRILVIAFEDVTTKPVDVVRAFNKRFETSFVLPEFTDKQLTNLKAGINSRNDASASPLPTPEKEEAKKHIRLLLKDEPMLSEARNVYEQLHNYRHQF